MVSWGEGTNKRTGRCVENGSRKKKSGIGCFIFPCTFGSESWSPLARWVARWVKLPPTLLTGHIATCTWTQFRFVDDVGTASVGLALVAGIGVCIVCLPSFRYSLIHSLNGTAALRQAGRGRAGQEEAVLCQQKGGAWTHSLSLLSLFTGCWQLGSCLCMYRSWVPISSPMASSARLGWEPGLAFVAQAVRFALPLSRHCHQSVKPHVLCAK